MKEFTLPCLLDPVSPDTFFAEYWEKKLLHISGRSEDYYADLFQRRDIGSLIFNGRLTVPHEIGVSKAGSHPVFADGSTPHLADVQGAYAAGYSVVLRDVQQRHQQLAVLCNQTQEFMGYPRARVNMYMTPVASYAFPLHIDTHEVFVLQIDGAKKWYIYEPYFELPSAEYKNTHPSHSDVTLIQEVELKAGDMLYLPRGFPHHAETVPEISSLHLTMGVFGVSWKQMLQTALDSLWFQDVRWRKHVPPGVLNQPEAADILKEQFEEMTRLLAAQASIADTVKEVVKQSHITPVPTGDFGAIFDDEQIAQRTLALNTVLRKFNDTAYGVVEDGERAVLVTKSLYSEDKSLAAPLMLKPVLQFIAGAGSEFPVKALPHLSPKSKLTLAQRLVAEGLLLPRFENQG